MSERCRCTSCNGSGLKTERVAKPCYACGGSGSVYQAYKNTWERCYSCHCGTSYETEMMQCRCCGGSGYAY